MCVYYYSTYCKTVRVTFYKEYAAKLWECLEDSVTALQTMSVNSRAGPNVCVFIAAGPSTKLFSCVGGDIGGHVLRETTS